VKSFVVHLSKERFKFSSSHFTIFNSTEAERLHGHNYRVACSFGVSSTKSDVGMAFAFNEVKPMIQTVCEALDEYVLIPEKSPYLKISVAGAQVHIDFHGKKYSLPKEDVKLLPVTNITSEELSSWISGELVAIFKKKNPQLMSGLKKLSVTVQETLGQKVSCVTKF
jgi:6-pyruvoyltetrahydropterin/6-carboxytetrahydropterin synthase